ncbi:MAG: hypothetical protein ACR2O3_02260 [Rhizobiaceae bacterium]
MNASRQLPFDLSLDPSVRREDLVESSANAMAVAMIDAWPEWPSHLTVLAGPVGSGKTHIANAWVSGAGGVVCNMRSISDFEQELQDCLDHKGNLVLEDAGAGIIDEVTLFHLVNSVRQANSYCLITSRNWPLEWGIKLPDLLSRLRAAQVIELLEPDDQLLKQVMIKLFADRQLMVDEKVIDYCVLRMERSLESVAKLVAEIDAEALARKSPITRGLAGHVLEKIENENSKNLET